MARQVKCAFCGNKGSSDEFYKIAINLESTRFSYYCSKEEYEMYKQLEEDKIAEKEALALEKEIQREIKKTETQKYNNLIKYVMENLLNYKKGMRVPKALKDKIEALREFYPYEVIYDSFKLSADSITWALNNKHFNNEFPMIYYIMSIVESNINDAYKKYLELEKLNNALKETVNEVETEIIQAHMFDLEYKPVKSNNGIASFLEEDEI